MAMTRGAKALSLIAALGVATATLSGCQSAVQLEDKKSEAPAEIVAGGTLHLAQAGDLAPMSVMAERAANGSWASSVLETLTMYDADMTPQPVLATDWTLSDDGLTMQLTLREGVKFHNGREMTADDVKFSIELSADPANAAQVGFIARTFTSITVDSPTQLTIEFGAPTPNVFDLFEQTPIVPEEAWKGFADGSSIIGTGPFAFDSWSPGAEAHLSRYDDYWGEPALLDDIEIAVITDSTAMLNAVRSGRADVALQMQPVDVTSLQADSSYKVINTSASAYPMGVSVEVAPFDKKEARQAIQYAVDRERIAEQVLGNDASRVTDLFWEPTVPGYPADLENYYSYDPEKAKDLLEQAGAVGAEVEITTLGLPANTAVAEIVRNNLEEVGLKPTLNVQEPQAWDANQVKGELGAMFLPLHGLGGVQPVTLLDRLPSLREGNPSHFWTDEYVELRTDLITATEDEYADALHALTEYVLDEAFTGVLVQSISQVVTTADVNGISFTSRGYVLAGDASISE